tara:strand:- start:3624 stop:3743 length:120 start_codon:yes stop_codon:yes gene_type:complete
MFHAGLFAEVEIRRLMKRHNIDRSEAIAMYLRQRIDQLD